MLRDEPSTTTASASSQLDRETVYAAAPAGSAASLNPRQTALAVAGISVVDRSEAICVYS